MLRIHCNSSGVGELVLQNVMQTKMTALKYILHYEIIIFSFMFLLW